MKHSVFKLDSQCFARLFGTSRADIERYCSVLIRSYDFRYRILSGKDRDEVLLTVLRRIFSQDLTAASAERRPSWEKGWNENLREFIGSGYKIDKLTPKYFKKNVPARLFGEYVMPVDEDFVFNVTCVFRSWLFQKYFRSVENIYEFGCGSGWHLAYLAKLFPGKRLFGFDWARSSEKILRLLSERYGWHMQTGNFDFFRPNKNIRILPDSGILTFGALEQLGDKHQSYLDFVIRRKPSICVDVVGLRELYEENNLHDYLAIQYHNRRNYLNGYLGALRKKERQGKVRIFKVHRQYFGNLFDDPHSYVVWKPK